MVTVWWLDLKLKSKICSQLKTIHSQSPKLGKFCLFFSNFPVALLLICSNLREAAFVLIIGLLSEYYTDMHYACKETSFLWIQSTVLCRCCDIYACISEMRSDKAEIINWSNAIWVKFYTTVRNILETPTNKFRCMHGYEEA